MDRTSTIAIVGAGAVGGYYGGRLAQHGFNVHFLLRSDYQAVRAQGLRVTSRDGDFTVPPQSIRVYDDPSRMPKADLVVVALKTTANRMYGPLITPLLKDDTAILTLQNGLGNEEQLAALFGPGRVLGGLVFACINRIGPGHIEHTDYGYIKLGELAGGLSPRATWIAQAFAASGVAAQPIADLRHGRWEKLVWNVPFNGLTAALDVTTDLLIADQESLLLVRSIMAEVIGGARGLNVRLSDELIDQKVQQTRTMGAYRTSMHLDRVHGRPMEVESIVGQPVRTAATAGVQMPLTTMLYRALRAVNLGRL
jgi:2-dehydropantoate 2-reductase